MHMYREIFEQPAVLRTCMEKNAAAIGAIAAAGGQIRNIVIAARGSSDHAGTYGKYLLEILTGVPVSLAACSVVTAYKTEMDYSGSLVIGLSQSGAAEDVAQVLERRGPAAPLTAAVTNFPHTRVARAAAHHLCLHAGEEKSVAATKTVTAQMLLLYLLACAPCRTGRSCRARRRGPGQNARYARALRRNQECGRLFPVYRPLFYSLARRVLSHGVGSGAEAAGDELYERARPVHCRLFPRPARHGAAEYARRLLRAH